MITTKQAINILKEKFPDRNITTGCLYKDKNSANEYYIFVAVKNQNKTEYNDPYFAVNSKTGEISYFTPAEDPDYFFDQYERNRVI